MKIKLFGGPFDGEEHEVSEQFLNISKDIYRPKNYAGLVSNPENIGSYSIYTRLNNTYHFVRSVEIVDESAPKIDSSNVKLTQEELDLVIKMATYCFYKDIANKARVLFPMEFNMQILLDFELYMNIMKKFEQGDQQLSFNNLLEQIKERLKECSTESKESI